MLPGAASAFRDARGATVSCPFLPGRQHAPAPSRAWRGTSRLMRPLRPVHAVVQILRVYLVVVDRPRLGGHAWAQLTHDRQTAERPVEGLR